MCPTAHALSSCRHANCSCHWLPPALEYPSRLAAQTLSPLRNPRVSDPPMNEDEVNRCEILARCDLVGVKKPARDPQVPPLRVHYESQTPPLDRKSTRLNSSH